MQQPMESLAPIAEKPSSSACSPQGGPSAVEGLPARPANRPSRLSAVLVPPAAGAPPGASSPPLSPPSVSPHARAASLISSTSGDGLSRLEKQESPKMNPAKVSPKAGPASPTVKGSTAAPPPSSPPAVSPKAAPSTAATRTPAPAAAAPLTHRRSSNDASSSSSSDQDSEWGWDTHTPAWYNQPGRVAVLLLLLASVGLVLAGLVCQVVFKDTDGTRDYQQVYPWLYFLAAWAPLALALRWLCWRLYTAAEYTAIREELYFLRPLKAKLAGLLFWMTNLLWFQACFHWLWCHDVCDEEDYQKALKVVWRLLICVTLFAAANFLKCAVARLLSYSFYRTAHFAKVRDAIERELYLIRLSQARSALLPPPPPPELLSDVWDQQGGLQAHHAGAWGSTVWRKTSQVFLGPYVHQPQPCQEAVAEEPGSDQEQQTPAGRQHSSHAAAASAFAGAFAQQQARQTGGMRHVSSADRIAEDATVHVQLRQASEIGPRPHHAALAEGHMGARLLDSQPILQHQLNSSATPTPKVSWLQADLIKAHQHQQNMQHHQHQHKHPRTDEPDKAGRQHSYELFGAERMPSILGSQQQQSRSGSKAGSRVGSRVGSRPGSRVGQGLLRSGRTGSTGKYSTSSARHVSLPGMVAGVDGLLLQPEVLDSAAEGQVQRNPGQPMTELELLKLRKRLGVNTFGTFVDRYYGMTLKEEAAHVRQVKRFAKGLFTNCLGDADRDHILPDDFLLFFDGDKETAHDAFDYFDRNKDGSISCSELQESAAEMLCERKNIAASIKDTDSVVNSLEAGLGMLIHFIFIALYLLVWGVNIVQGFTTFSATALALTFVFGDSVKGVFESALYLFVEHPYDVGDAIWMPPGMVCRVKKIDLQFTVLLYGDGKLIWHPNSALRLQPLINLSRSQPRWEAYTVLVDIDTPDEVLTQLAEALAKHVATQRAHFACDPSVMYRSFEDPLKLRLAVGVTYSFTGEDTGRYATQRHGILSVMRRELHRLGVKYTVPVQQQSFTPIMQPATTPLM